VLTIAVIVYAARGIGGGLLAAVIAFAPSFAFILIGGRHFDALRGNERARAFLDGAGPAAIGAILGASIPLAFALGAWWQVVLLGVGAGLLFVVRRGVVFTLLALGVVGSILVGGHIV
jgi:chromate transporter